MSKLTEFSRIVNAESLNDIEIVNSFEPNEEVFEDNSVKRLCSYDRVADPRGTYYLVGERGTGKTHILSLLKNQLLANGHIALEINLWNSPILENFMRLKASYPNETMSNLWTLAILEESVIGLFDSYIKNEFISSTAFKFFPWLLTRSLLTRYEFFFDYIKEYRPETWKKYSKQLNLNAQNIWRFFSKIKIMVPIAGNISFEFDPSIYNLQIHQGGDELKLGERIRLLSNSLWGTLSSHQKDEKLSYAQGANLFNRFLPDHLSIYIIADGLDQTDHPLTHDELLGLIYAIRYLNASAMNFLGLNPNFKAVMAIRYITYEYYLSARIADLEQIRSNVEILKWSVSSLKRLLARRILGLSNSIPINQEQVSTALQKSFPDPLYYFGVEFASAADFLITIAGLRPRQVLLYWQNCASLAGYRDRPYQATLSSNDLIKGLQTYAQELATDLTKEYDLEYQGLFDLLQYLAFRSRSIHRISPRKTVSKMIAEYLSEKQFVTEKPKWLQKSAEDILDIFYQIGIIGLPINSNIRDKWFDWSHVYYFSNDPYKSIKDHDSIAIHPSFWGWITDVKTEIALRRRYTLSLYSTFLDTVNGLCFFIDNIFAQLNANRYDSEEYIGKFLTMVKLVRENINIPETVDFKISENLKINIERSLTSFSQTIFVPFTPSESQQYIVDQMLNFYAKVMLKSPPTHLKSELDFCDAKELEGNRVKAAREYTRVKSLWLTGHNITVDEYKMIEGFRNGLSNNNDSLANVVRSAIDELNNVIKG